MTMALARYQTRPISWRHGLLALVFLVHHKICAFVPQVAQPLHHHNLPTNSAEQFPAPFSHNGHHYVSSRTIQTQLSAKLWDRLQIEEDPEPYWYLINCVAGLELDLLRQCRATCDGMEDAVKFVVPMETKTRSHGASRMVTEKKVKYQGYVFGKLRLCPEVYEAIQGLDLCRSWMGTVNHKGYKKLPPSPLALNEDEVASFGLEDLDFDEDELLTASSKVDDDIIVDEVGADDGRPKVDQDALKVYLGLRVGDMVKVTGPGKFFNEDGIVRRLKDGKIFLRFYTYGSMFEEWMDPADVRKLTEIEVLKGLSGPSQPITQQDFDGPRDRYDRYADRDGTGGGPRTLRSNLMGNVRGAGDVRNRRQDRTERGERGNRDLFGRTREERDREERNWKWYQQNRGDRRHGGNNEVSDDEWTYKPQLRNNDRGDGALSDVNSQWGRPSQRQERRDRRNTDSSMQDRRNRQDDDDWSAFVSPASAPAPSDEDAFFADLMTDLTKDLSSGNEGSNNRPSRGPTPAPRNSENQGEDDFFESLMAEISTDEASSGKQTTGDDDVVDDFFSSLAVEEPTTPTSSRQSTKDETFDDDDFFGSFDFGDSAASSNGKSNTSPKSSESDDDDFFSSLDAELVDVLDDGVEPSGDEGEFDFFASLEEGLSSQINTDGDRSPVITNDSTDIPAPSPPLSAAGQSHGAPNSAELQKLTVPRLKEMLRDRGLKVSGKKSELIERLAQ